MNYKYFLYYFIFTLVLIGIRGQLSESLLSEPVIRDFFNLTGFFSLIAYFIFKNKSEKRGVSK